MAVYSRTLADEVGFINNLYFDFSLLFLTTFDVTQKFPFTCTRAQVSYRMKIVKSRTTNVQLNFVIKILKVNYRKIDSRPPFETSGLWFLTVLFICLRRSIKYNAAIIVCLTHFLLQQASQIGDRMICIMSAVITKLTLICGRFGGFMRTPIVTIIWVRAVYRLSQLAVCLESAGVDLFMALLDAANYTKSCGAQCLIY